MRGSGKLFKVCLATTSRRSSSGKLPGAWLSEFLVSLSWCRRIKVNLEVAVPFSQPCAEKQLSWANDYLRISARGLLSHYFTDADALALQSPEMRISFKDPWLKSWKNNVNLRLCCYLSTYILACRILSLSTAIDLPPDHISGPYIPSTAGLHRINLVLSHRSYKLAAHQRIPMGSVMYFSEEEAEV
jgi:hypothetical protein